MDMIPIGKFILLLVICGVILEFPLAMVSSAIIETMDSMSGVGSSDPYVKAVLWLCISLPVWVVILGGSYRLWMQSQKRSSE